MYGTEEVFTQVFGGKKHLDDVDIDGRVLLKWS
jgi:hypothetical protein